MKNFQDGPSSPNFKPLTLRGNADLRNLARADVSPHMKKQARYAPRGECVCWGVPFRVNSVVATTNKPVSVKLAPTQTPWLIFLHAADTGEVAWNKDGFLASKTGSGRMAEQAAVYTVIYSDGSEKKIRIRHRCEVGMFHRGWGENATNSVPHHKPQPWPPHHEQQLYNICWGHSQTRATAHDGESWQNWLFAWKNPCPNKRIVGLRVEPAGRAVVLSAITAGKATAQPLRWRSRRKAIVRLPKGTKLQSELDQDGLLKQIQLDLGQVVSAQIRFRNDNMNWSKSQLHVAPRASDQEILVEYTSHEDAIFHVQGGKTVAVSKVETAKGTTSAKPVKPATQLVTLRVVEKGSRKPVPVRLHVHGEADEYLAPVDRHRIPNQAWFEDYSVDVWSHGFYATYIPGETSMNLPLGKVFIEVTKGFEIAPVRKTVRVTRTTRRITIELTRVLNWRKSGWISADTHVHFLSPTSALLEGAAEGVNVVNLLASQWGELMTNVGDFDGKTTHGAIESGGDGEHLVRVGTENRQHVMGHISLLGYEGGLIGPMCTGGPDESALGDPLEVLMTEWAQQCRKQNGIVIIPHFPNPRLETAASIVSGNVDGVEMQNTNGFVGISPYSISDWYRYLNCGYMVPVVGGTDKMSSWTRIGNIRTYARIAPEHGFTYDSWKKVVRSGETFVTIGPLVDFLVEGKPAGSRIRMRRSGGTVNVTYKVESVIFPMSRVDLVVNGEIRESRSVNPVGDQGTWSFKVDRSSWIALLVRGCYPGHKEVIAAHSSPVMVEVAGTEFYAAADALSILQQVEGALAFLDTLGTRAETAVYKRMLLLLTSVHRRLHNRMHRLGNYHEHTVKQNHPEHR